MKPETDRLNRNRRRREDAEEEEPEEEEDHHHHHHHHHHDDEDAEEGNEEEEEAEDSDDGNNDNDDDDNDKEAVENVVDDEDNNPNNSSSSKKRRKSTHTNDTEDTYGADNRTSINRTTAAAVLAAAAAVAQEEQSTTAASSRHSAAAATNTNTNASIASSSNNTTAREHRMSVNSQYTAATSSSTRLESFTEAVPLSLSSMAHASVPLEEGVLDGIKQMLHHTLLSCVNYARIVHPPHQWTFRDLTTSKFAWEPHKSTDQSSPHASSNSTTSMTATSAEVGGSKGNNNNNNSSSKTSQTNNSNAASSKKRGTTAKTATTTTTGLDAIQQMPWALQKMQFKHEYTRNALIYLQAALPADLTVATEMAQLPTWYDQVGVLGRVSLRYLSTEPLTQGEMDGTDTDDMPPCILYKIEVEYRSLPPTGNQQAVQAEELSMLSFGGSVDDDVKYGALASLYDKHAKYVLEIFSVRGKKYKFDLMDSTLSDGTIPHLPSSRQGDPFAKSLCVTVTDHDRPFTLHDNSTSYAAENKKKYAITRMHLLLEGKPRQGNNFDDLPAFDYIANSIAGSFLIFNPRPPQIVTAFPSGHALLLDPEYAGRIYVNGRYVTTWGQDPRIGSHGLALFGMDLHSIPFWHGRIIDYEALKLAYGQLWHEILIDARLMSLNIGGRLLARLMTGHDPPEEDNDEDLYDDDDEDDQGSQDTNVDCLESQVMSSAQYDPVGISPKALSTRFSMVYGNDAFPCLAHEMEWIKSIFPDRKPVAVPQRLIPILRRGGYFTAQQCYDELWFSESRPPRVGNERAIIDAALQRLDQAGCADEIALEQIAIVSKPPVVSISCMAQKTVCRFSEKEQMFCVHEKFFNDPAVVEEYLAGPLNGDQDALIRGYLLGMYLAKEHSNGRVLARYILRNNPL